MPSWRKWARVVAVVRLVFMSLVFSALLLGIIFPSQVAALMEEDYPDFQTGDSDVDLSMIRILLGVTAAILVPFLILDIYLLKETKQGVDTAFALKVTKTWLGFYIVGTVFSAFRMIQLMTSGNMLAMPQVAIMLLFLYVVHKYIQELQESQMQGKHSVAFEQRTNFA